MILRTAVTRSGLMPSISASSSGVGTGLPMTWAVIHILCLNLAKRTTEKKRTRRQEYNRQSKIAFHLAKAMRVFISYSHENDSRDSKVLELAGRLRTADGIDAIVDRYVAFPPEGWPRWVMRQIDEAKFVLCVCSPTYHAAFEGRTPPGNKLGVNQEGYLITQSLYQAGHASSKFIPVLFEGDADDSIPRDLADFTRFKLPPDYDRLVRLLTGNTVIAPPLGPSPEVRSNGFSLQAEITAPEAMPLTRLAPGEGLYLSRIINPQRRGEKDIISTVWLAARGARQYIVDSIRIKDVVAGLAGPAGVVAEPPDAEYRFTFTEGSDQIHALNPALSIGPETRQRASFTLGITAAGPLYAIAHFSLWLRYQTTSGAAGTLQISEPEPHLQRLAKILSADFVFAWTERNRDEEFEIGISAAGVQFGLDQANRPSLWYRNLLIPSWYSMTVSRTELLAERTRIDSVIRRLRPIYSALSKPEALQGLREWASEGDEFPLDLLGALDNNTEPSGNSPAIRHLIAGDDLLVQRTLAGPPTQRLDDAVLAALMLRPVAGATGVFVRLRDQDPRKFRNLLAAVQDDLDKPSQQRLFEPPGPLPYAVYLRGSFNAWGTSNRFEYTGAGIYACVLAIGEGRHELKVATERWFELNCGGQNESSRIVINQPFGLFEEQFMTAPAFNLILDLFDRPAGTYRFVLDATRVAELHLVVEPFNGA